ncbi:hypothetical protein ESCNG_320004 [Neisseria gonorrhoeae]|nr:hypothetical protein ESCNG_290003 [Neisseria gonorrhoeae]SCW14939.1 hypothetical protein ESCNG_320004 [Neisseria gonorrhoeae]SCW17467.1 hypothetical protein ESCNG_410003 [Neisseria gonorrhoeae]SCW20234.1 hypothetical protein ESCNG_860003 [Neisseria gonorrhoeae]
MVEHLLCKQGVIGSIPFASTKTLQMKASLLFLAAYFDLRSRITTHRSLTNWKAEINKQRQ